MTRRGQVVAAVLLGGTGCFPLSPDPTATESGTAGTMDATGPASSTGATSATSATGATGATGTTGEPEPTSADPPVTTQPPGSTGGTPGDRPLEPWVTEVWRFDAMDLGDVDGDGRLDLVTSGTGAPPRVTVYPGRGDGTFDREAAVESTLWSFSAFVVADVTGDGRADVLAKGTGAPPRVTLYAGQENLGFVELQTTRVFTSTHMHAGDVGGDGFADLLIGAGEGLPPWVDVWPGSPTGLADAPGFEGELWRYDLLRSGDVNGDGRADVVTASLGSPPQLYVHAGKGAGGFGAPVISQISTLSWFDVGDVDGDGRADAVTDVPGNGWRFLVYRSLPGGWSEPTSYSGYTFERFELGDVDGDGRADLVAWGSGEPPRVEVYLAADF
ncbi:MAG TPA: VCBS repeat-containing protein [Nannocystis sp.]